jgi:hypothetical protein
MSREVSQRGHIPERPGEPGYGRQRLYPGRADNVRGTPGYGPPGYGPPNHQGGRPPGTMRRYAGPHRPGGQRNQGASQRSDGPAPIGQPQRVRPPKRKVRFRRTRRFFRRPAVRICSAIIAIFLVVVLFSAGQAAFKNNGQGFSANLAEWARDHYLGPVVTFGEW